MTTTMTPFAKGLVYVATQLLLSPMNAYFSVMDYEPRKVQFEALRLQLDYGFVCMIEVRGGLGSKPNDLLDEEMTERLEIALVTVPELLPLLIEIRQMSRTGLMRFMTTLYPGYEKHREEIFEMFEVLNALIPADGLLNGLTMQDVMSGHLPKEMLDTLEQKLRDYIAASPMLSQMAIRVEQMMNDNFPADEATQVPNEDRATFNELISQLISDKELERLDGSEESLNEGDQEELGKLDDVDLFEEMEKIINSDDLDGLNILDDLDDLDDEDDIWND